MSVKIKTLVSILILCVTIPIANAANNKHPMVKTDGQYSREINTTPNPTIKYSVKVFEKRISNTDGKISASGVYNNSSPLIANIQNNLDLKFFWTKFSHGNIIERFPPKNNESCDFNITNNNFIIALRRTDLNTYEYSIKEINIGHNNFFSKNISKNFSYRATSWIKEEESIRIEVRDSNSIRIYLITPNVM